MMNDRKKEELRSFLLDRRARVNPRDVGLPGTGRRRVKGLRREEVASLAGVSLTWYTMFETGRADGASAEVVESIARALQLNRAECEYLRMLASRDDIAETHFVISDTVKKAVNAIAFPAYVITTTWDVLVWNQPYARIWGRGSCSDPYNKVLEIFMNSAIRGWHGDRWEQFARSVTAMFRVGYGKPADAARFEELLAVLLEDEHFTRFWNEHDVARPLEETTVEVDTASVGRFRYSVLNCPLPDSANLTLVIQVPDAPSAQSLCI